ncbi:Nn.00g018960.m01.CDS01 [Neocucurbitaria sp. VM-36]
MSEYNGDAGTFAGGSWDSPRIQSESGQHNQYRPICDERYGGDTGDPIADYGNDFFRNGRDAAQDDLNRAPGTFALPVNRNMAPPAMPGPPSEQRGPYHDSHLYGQRSFSDNDTCRKACSWNNYYQQTESTAGTMFSQDADTNFGESIASQQMEWAAPYQPNYPDMLTNYPTENGAYGSDSLPGFAGTETLTEMDRDQYKPDTRSGSSLPLNYDSVASPPLRAPAGPLIQSDILMSYNEGPWSAQNPREDERKAFLGTEIDELLSHAGISNPSHPSLDYYDDRSSVPSGNPESLATSMNSDTDNMMRSWSTIRPESSYHFAAGPHIQLREGTPGFHDIPDNDSSSLPIGSTQLLSVPHVDVSNSEPSSPGSAASPYMPDVLLCNECGIEYTGEWRKGTLARHKRLKHKDAIIRILRQGRLYPVDPHLRGVRIILTLCPPQDKNYRTKISGVFLDGPRDAAEGTYIIDPRNPPV